MISNDSTDPGLEEATNPGGEALEEEPSLDPIEDAWLSQEPETVEALAKSRLAENPDDGRARAWLGMSGDEFIRAWETGEIEDPDRSDVMMLVLMLPLTR